MAYANFVFGECLGDCGGEFGQLDALSAIGGRFSRLRRDLLNGVFRLVKIEKGAESTGYASYCTSMLTEFTFVPASLPLRYLRSD
jgi:hypothetical protein